MYVYISMQMHSSVSWHRQGPGVSELISSKTEFETYEGMRSCNWTSLTSIHLQQLFADMTRHAGHMQNQSEGAHLETHQQGLSFNIGKAHVHVAHVTLLLIQVPRPIQHDMLQPGCDAII